MMVNAIYKKYKMRPMNFFVHDDVVKPLTEVGAVLSCLRLCPTRVRYGDTFENLNIGYDDFDEKHFTQLCINNYIIPCWIEGELDDSFVSLDTTLKNIGMVLKETQRILKKTDKESEV